MDPSLWTGLLAHPDGLDPNLLAHRSPNTVHCRPQLLQMKAVSSTRLEVSSHDSQRVTTLRVVSVSHLG